VIFFICEGIYLSVRDGEELAAATCRGMNIQKHESHNPVKQGTARYRVHVEGV